MSARAHVRLQVQEVSVLAGLSSALGHVSCGQAHQDVGCLWCVRLGV